MFDELEFLNEDLNNFGGEVEEICSISSDNDFLNEDFNFFDDEENVVLIENLNDVNSFINDALMNDNIFVETVEFSSFTEALNDIFNEARSVGNTDKQIGWIKKADMKKYMSNPRVQKKFKKAIEKIKKRHGKPFTSVNDKLKDWSNQRSIGRILGNAYQLFRGVEFYKTEGVVVVVINTNYGMFRKVMLPYMTKYNQVHFLNINIIGGKGTTD